MTLAQFRRLNAKAAEAASRALELVSKQPIRVAFAEAAIVPRNGSRSRLRDRPIVAGVSLPIEGRYSGSILLCFPEQDALALGRRLVAATSMGRQTSEAIQLSALREVGNIICGHYVTVLANELRERLMPGLPRLVGGELELLVSDLVAEAAARGGRLAVRVEIELAGAALKGDLLVFLHSESLIEA